MRVRTLVDMLTLSTNLYMISKDQEFMKNLSEMADKGKKKFEKFMDDISAAPEKEESDSKSGEAEEETEGRGAMIMERLIEKAKVAKAELEEKMEEVAKKVYAKMQIAHVEQVEELREEIEALKMELSLAESRIVELETTKHTHRH